MALAWASVSEPGRYVDTYIHTHFPDGSEHLEGTERKSGAGSECKKHCLNQC